MNKNEAYTQGGEDQVARDALLSELARRAIEADRLAIVETHAQD